MIKVLILAVVALSNVTTATLMLPNDCFAFDIGQIEKFTGKAPVLRVDEFKHDARSPELGALHGSEVFDFESNSDPCLIKSGRLGSVQFIFTNLESLGAGQHCGACPVALEAPGALGNIPYLPVKFLGVLNFVEIENQSKFGIDRDVVSRSLANVFRFDAIENIGFAVTNNTDVLRYTYFNPRPLLVQHDLVGITHLSQGIKITPIEAHPKRKPKTERTPIMAVKRAIVRWA